MPLKSSGKGMDSTAGGGTCVLILSEKPHSVNHYKNSPNPLSGLGHIPKVIVSTENSRPTRRVEEKLINDANQSCISKGVEVFVPMLTNAPRDFNECPSRGVFQGYVHTLKAMKKLKEQYEAQTSSRFILYARSNAFGDGDWMEGKHRVAWEIAPNSRPGISLPFQGVPFFIVGHAIYDCRHGRRRKPSRICKKEAVSPGSPKKRKVPQQNSIKIGCPAQILMREVIMFPEFKLGADTLKRRQLMSQKLRKGIQLHNEGKDMLQTERRIYIYFPRPDEHHHRLNKCSSNGSTKPFEPVDPRILKKIHSLVSQGLTGTKKIREHVSDYVREILPDGSPAADRCRYNPSDQDIKNAMKKAQVEIRKAKRKATEQQCVVLMHGIREHLTTLKNEKYLVQLRDHLSHLNALVKNEESLESLLLCYQTSTDNEQQTQPSGKKIKGHHLKEEISITGTEIVEAPEQTLFTTDYTSNETVPSQHPTKAIDVKAEHIEPILEIPGVAAPSTYTYSNTYENREPNQIIYQEEVPQNHDGQVEGVTQIYYYQKIPSQGDIYTISNQPDCSQVPYNITEFIKDPLT
ncbi:uncharacterized protein [Palaemon carinicauda]|uniref:uncharacterized protein n=1 Tax=Palaemon carinicauda TaxID=392227 RepID=UPI0035B58032